MALDKLTTPQYRDPKPEPKYEKPGIQGGVECSVLSEKGSLPIGDSTQGMTKETMAEASAADVKAGSFDALEKDPSELTNILWPEKPAGGFLGRPNGWER